MDNENKELEFESGELTANQEELEFDPTESEAFYSNLEAAIGLGDEPETPDVSEILLAGELFGGADDDYQEKTDSKEDDLFAGVDAALAEQIAQEFGSEEETGSAKEKEPNKFLSTWNLIPNWTKILVGVILAVLISVGLLFGTSGGRKLVYKVIVGIAFNWVEEDPEVNQEITSAPSEESTPTPTPVQDNGDNQNPDTTPEPTVDPVLTPEATPTPAITIMDDDDIINVLLLGEENIYNAKRGRADAIIVVSVDLNGGPLKMVSFQRDLYVSIPGYADDKLNAAYAYGGSKLIMETIEKNFGIDIDAYVKVNFAGFENIIDQLGGLRLSLTAKESEYLNTTKYISKPEERNTVAGYQTMTGSQVLGYCRVRYVPTAEGLANDRGRNYRHRVVLQAIFNKYKEKSFAELATVMRQCFNYVTVSSNLEELAVDCLQAVTEKQMFTIDTLQIPKTNLYNDPLINGQKVIVAFPENVDALQDFLYGDE